MKIVDKYFGCDVFSKREMEKYLPNSIYKQMVKVMEDGDELPPQIADVVANAMKDWAMDKGATHYTHWFQPMTGITAEKHDAFINPTGPNTVISDFRGKELIKGEPDASSFPSGGLRATFEARGYTAWDPTSYAFVKEKTLYIPTLFCSYDGSALDKKTPLLRSIDALNTSAVRLLNLMGYDTKKINITVGPEQEYFLIDEAMYKQRLDLMVTGRTLFGAPPVKGQELDDHYFGNINERVKAYMEEVDEELWKLGVFAKTEHKEVAPCQFELAPVYTSTNQANDQNQLTMEILQRCATRHGFVCLLHEKPFEGINGSGKHNNWSFTTDEGENVLEPGDSPQDNIRFLTMLAAIIKGVDEHQDLLRLAVATAGNDHRLGANEAPPAIISIFLGDELTAVLESIENDTTYDGVGKELMKIGADVLPKFTKDTTDRNRTSPFAFTGNKFEFRMPGSALSVAQPNIMLNTVIADVLCDFANELENADDFESALHALIQRTLKQHKRIVFNGNGYDDAWVEEAKRRGLLNLKTTVDALPYSILPENIALFERQGVLRRDEIVSRYEIMMEEYTKVLNIEALTMIDMAKKQILPAIVRFEKELADTIVLKRAVLETLPSSYETGTLEAISTAMEQAFAALKALEVKVAELHQIDDFELAAAFVRDVIIPAMDSLRAPCDQLEMLTDTELWPFPTYGKLLFGII